MKISISSEERINFLTTMCGSAYRVLHALYEKDNEELQNEVLSALAESMKDLEMVMDLYGIPRNPEGVASAMMLTEDLIGCEPCGELLSVSGTEAVRKVTSCPWASLFSQDGSTCRFIMEATQKGIADKHGLRITCEQSIAGGSDYCIWKVSRKQ